MRAVVCISSILGFTLAASMSLAQDRRVLKASSRVPAEYECSPEMGYEACSLAQVDLNKDGKKESILLSVYRGEEYYGYLAIQRRTGKTLVAMEMDENATLTDGSQWTSVALKGRPYNGWEVVCATRDSGAERCFAWDGTRWSYRLGMNAQPPLVEYGKAIGGLRLGMTSEDATKAAEANVVPELDGGKVVSIRSVSQDQILPDGLVGLPELAAVRNKYPQAVEACFVQVQSLKGAVEPWAPEHDCRDTSRVLILKKDGVAFLELIEAKGFRRYCNTGALGARSVVVFRPGADPAFGEMTSCPDAKGAELRNAPNPVPVVEDAHATAQAEADAKAQAAKSVESSDSPRTILKRLAKGGSAASILELVHPRLGFHFFQDQGNPGYPDNGLPERIKVARHFCGKQAVGKEMKQSLGYLNDLSEPEMLTCQDSTCVYGMGDFVTQFHFRKDAGKWFLWMIAEVEGVLDAKHTAMQARKTEAFARTSEKTLCR